MGPCEEAGLLSLPGEKTTKSPSGLFCCSRLISGRGQKNRHSQGPEKKINVPQFEKVSTMQFVKASPIRTESKYPELKLKNAYSNKLSF